MREATKQFIECTIAWT